MKSAEFNLRHLSGFVKTYELGTLLAASQAVHMTQPALTQGLSRLEDQLDVRLFERRSDGMEPTDAAHVLHPRAVVALGHIQSPRVTQAQLRAFSALAKSGSYVEAARATKLSRATLHRAVSDLEISLNERLVAKRGRGIELTARGKAVARRFKLARNEFKTVVHEIHALSGPDRGTVIVGAMPLSRARILPDTIIAFNQRERHAGIGVVEGSYDELVDQLRDGDVDFILGALRPPPWSKDLIQISLFEDQPSIVARADHPIFSKLSSFSLETLSKYEWCIPKSGIPLRDNWEHAFRTAKLPPPAVSIECGSASTIRQILKGTDFLSVLSYDQVAQDVAAKTLSIVAPAPLEMTRTIGVSCRENWRPSDLHRAFLDALKDRANHEMRSI